jgi:hypothetical protein
LRWHAVYSFVDATYQSNFLLNGESNSTADENGDIQVTSGNRIPLIPRHTGRLMLDYARRNSRRVLELARSTLRYLSAAKRMRAARKTHGHREPVFRRGFAVGGLPRRTLAPECQRIELAVCTVNSLMNPGSCGGEFKNPAIKWNVKNRRFYIADPERGAVLAIGNFTTPPEYPKNNGSVVFEVFKVQDGLIRQIEAFFRGNGQLHSGWGSGPGS